MEYDTTELTRQYRLNFNRGEPLWSDGIPPEITSDVTGLHHPDDRTGEPARLDIAEHMPRRDRRSAFHGWIRMVVSTNSNFDEPAFKREVADVVNGVKLLRADQKEYAVNVMQADAAPRGLALPNAQGMQVAC